jgi:hypothetical protein
MKKLTTWQFIEKANKIHNNKYDYSLVEYNGINTPVKIICPIHGEFLQIAYVHLITYGCPKCGNNISCKKQTYKQEKVIFKFKQIHGDKYDYSLVEYENNLTPVKIICPIHGEFLQTPKSHKKCGCPKCGNNIKLTTEQFIEKARKIHGDKFDYSLVEYVNARTKIKIICKKHGIFEQTPDNHYKYIGCPKCCGSIGESEVRKILQEKNIKFEEQKRFKNCKNKYTLPFDFYLPEYNLCIEYQGIQHFESIEWFGGKNKLQYTQQNDQIKRNYCKDNNIILLEIKYNDNIKLKLLL